MQAAPAPPTFADVPLVSVIMPCFNADKYVEEAVRSVFAQSHQNIELIVVDDGSEDESVEVLKQLKEEFGPRLTLLQTSHAGPYPARNHGLKVAKGAWIAFLDADDYWANDCIESLLQAAKTQAADLAYCGWQNVGNAPAGNAPYVPPEYESGDAAASFLHTCPWPIHAALIKQETVHAIAGFSTRRFSSMDYDFWLRAYAHSQRIVRAPKVLAFYRWHGSGQVSAIKWRQVIDAWIVRRDFLRHAPKLVEHLSEQQRRELVDGTLLRSGYIALWKRDLVSAHKIFRQAFKAGIWKTRDLSHVVPSLLPFSVFRRLVSLFGN